MRYFFRCLWVSLGVLALAARSAEPQVVLTVDVAHPGHAVSPTLHGVFFEDINYGADGGLYAELVQNRSFEHAEALYAWGLVNRGGDGTVAIATANPLNANNPHYARLTVRAAGDGFGLANYGYGGIVVRAGARYRFSVRARAGAGYAGGLRAAIEGDTGQVAGGCRFGPIGPDWTEFDGLIASAANADHARLVVLADGPGTVDLDVVSLFPEATWKGRRNGLRADLVQKLADLHPAFMRFPGGCIVEGTDLPNAYRWKSTIGDIAQRPENWNRWMHAMRRNDAPEYYQSYGLGFFEYFQLCEDIGAQPLPILNCGMACQYQTAQLVPLDQLGPFVQDALDLIEYANGPATSVWGARRAAAGHPEPFHLRYLGIGNEQWGAHYFERYRIFRDAIKAKYPEIELVVPSGPGVGDSLWNLAWTRFRTGTPADLVDEHYYRPPEWFFANADRYDSYDRRGPRIFGGEFAAHEGDRGSTLRAALAEAAFMTGLVRNSDVVAMASYAPLFSKAGSSQWAPDLIWFDNTRVYATPSYYVQRMFGRNRPEAVLPVRVDPVGAPPPGFAGRVGVGTIDGTAEFKDVVLRRPGRPLYRGDFSTGLGDWRLEGGAWAATDGVLRQTAPAGEARALVGESTDQDLTLTLKARRLGGREGFVIYFQAADSGLPGRMRLGAEGDTQNMLEIGGGIWSTWVPPTTEIIATGRWYDVRLELQGGSIRCFLDGSLVGETRRPAPQPIYAAAGIDRATGEVVLFAVNPALSAVSATIDLGGRTGAAAGGRAIVLTSDRPDDKNSFEEPDRVAPRETVLPAEPARFAYQFPANSVTVLRLRPE